MRNSLIYLIGVITLVVVLGISHVTMAYVNWSPTITPNPVTSIVSDLQASYTWGTSSPIGPTSSSPLYVYIPGNIYLGQYADYVYTGAVNFTVTLYNSGPTSGSATVYVSCPSPLGSTSASVTVGATSSASVTLTLTANINGPVTSPGQFLQCSVYTSLSTNNVTAVSVQLPIEITNYGIDFYGGAYHPAFTIQFYAPYFTFGTSTYEPSLSIVPFAGLTMGSTLYLVQTGSSASDTSAFSLPTPSSAGQTYSLEFIFVSLPATSSAGHYYYILEPFLPTQLLGGKYLPLKDGSYYSQPNIPGVVINQQSGANWVTLYTSPGGITIEPSTNLFIQPSVSAFPFYTNATTWYSYSGAMWSGSWFNVPAFAIPVPPGQSENVWVLMFMRNESIYGSHLWVPVLLMFNIVGLGYSANTTLLTQVNGASTNPLPPGVSIPQYIINVHGNYTWVNVTLATPIGKIIGNTLDTAGYLYSPTSITVLTGQLFSANYTTSQDWGFYTYAYASNYYLFADDFLVSGSFTPNNNTVFGNTAVSGSSMVPYGLIPIFNVTSAGTSNAPLWRFGISMQYVNVPVTSYENVTVVTAMNQGINLAVSGVSLSGNPSWMFNVVPNLGFRQYLSVHTIQYFINVTDLTGAGWAVVYPTSSSQVNATVFMLYPNGTSALLGYKLVPIWTSTRVFNFTIATYYVSSSNTFVTDLILGMNQAPQVADVWYSQFVPGATVYTTTYSSLMSPAPMVTTSSSGYVFMGYGVPYDTAYGFGSTNEVYTNIMVTRYGLGTTMYVTYPSVVGTVSYSFSIPSNASDDSVLLFNDPVQPLSAVNVTSVSTTPSSQSVQAGSATNITVTIQLSAPVQVTQAFQGTVSLNGTTVATFTITVPQGASSASTTVMFVAPSKPGTYYGVVSVNGRTSTFTLTVTPSYAQVGTVLLIVLVLIIVVVAVVMYRRRGGGGTVTIRI
jgi:hypothetical protein